MPIPHDRDYYRCLETSDLVRQARDEGINPEMSVAMAERLASTLRRHYGGHVDKLGFEFNFNGGTNA